MTTTINASTVSGLVNSADTSGILQLQTASTAALTIDASQRVGIGTTSPTSTYRTSIKGDYSSIIGGVEFDNGGGDKMAVSFASATSPSFIFANQSSTGVLRFDTNATERMRIDSSGNVGIGTSSPTFSSGGGLHVNVAGAGPSILHLTTGNQGTTASDGLDVKFYGGDATLWNYETGYMAFATSNTERMRITSGGATCIGTTGSISSGNTTIYYSGAVYNGLSISESANTSGTTFIVFGLDNTAIGTITRVAGTSAVSYNTTSDERLKSNITDASAVLDKLMDVKVRQFDWTEGDLHQDYGFIAQELEPTLSGLVTKGKTDEDMWQMDYSRLTPHLVKAIQELKTLNDTQAETINALTARIVALEGK